ncbi:MAG TPA: hypothetical protein VH684_16685 [Xanthobacteraceae bacterium]
MIPLSPLAIKSLRALPKGKPNAYIFAGANGGRLEEDDLTEALQDLTGTDATAHGLRATYQTWADENPTDGYYNAVQESLHHGQGGKLKVGENGEKVRVGNQASVYRRGTRFDKRRKVLNKWSTFLAT